MYLNHWKKIRECKPKILTCVFFFVLFTSCQYVGENQKNENNRTQTLQVPTEITERNKEDEELKENVGMAGLMILPVSYRIDEESDKISTVIDSSWRSVYKKNGIFQVGKINFKIGHTAEEPCSLLPTEYVEAEENVLVWINIPSIRSGKIDTIAFSKHVIHPSESLSFNDQKAAYKIIASGKTFEDLSGEEDPYVLKLFKNEVFVANLVIQSEFNDTVTELKMIADLDQDDLPDFIFSSPRHYEEHRLIIFLSSSAYTCFEEYVSFDC